MSLDFTKKNQRNVIFAVTFGNLLEWYEIYLYVYWSPIIAKLFFNPQTETTNLTTTLLIFALGLLARPIGGLYFGRLGDRIGRKKAFIISLMMMTIPTFLTGLLPTYPQAGVFAPIFLTLTRFLQAFPAGGELPGAFCYLYESAQLNKRRYFCSWACFGVLSGLLISTIECFALESLLSQEDLIAWGWRLSFLVGGLLGLSGVYIRSRLHETPLFQEMSKHSTIVKQPILQVLSEHRKALFMGTVFWLFNSATGFFITVNASEYFKEMLNNNYKVALFFMCSLLLLIIISLPFFGIIAEKVNNRKLLILSLLAGSLLLLPLSYFVTHSSLVGFTVAIAILALVFSCNNALLSYITPELFPTRVRYTCVAISFNVSDTIVGGFTPFLVIYLSQRTKFEGVFCWVILLFAILSLVSYIYMKEKHPINQVEQD